MSQAKKRSVYQPREESGKRFKPGTSIEQGSAVGIAVQTQQQELSPATGAMSLQCAEVRTSSSWHDDQTIRLCQSLFK